MEKTSKNDFIELEFTAKIKDSGLIFDTNNKSDAEKAKLPLKDIKPLDICIGQEMVVKGFDKELEGKEIGKEYVIDVSPKDAFGARNPKLMRTVPMKIFMEKQINPYPGLMLNMDGMLARIISVSGGRVMVDFNNPLSGKIIEYKFKILKKIEKAEDKIKSLASFFYGEKPEVKLEGKKAEIELKSKRNTEHIIKKTKEILGIDLEIKEKKKEEKKETEKEKERKEERREEEKKKEEVKKESESDKKSP